MTPSGTPTPRITITDNGPYLVSGPLPVSEQAITPDDGGNAWTWAELGRISTPERFALCRCGHSASKPFCDGSHARVEFDGTETASPEPFDQAAERIDGPTLELADDRPLCSFARFCDGYGGIWDSVTDASDDASRKLVVHQATHCPSGRLVIRDKTQAGQAVEPDHEPSIVLVEDPQENASGPIWVRGGVTIVSATRGEYETRNRVTLCRCGQSSNKPFCDGTHAHIGFRAHDSSPS